MGKLNRTAPREGFVLERNTIDDIKIYMEENFEILSELLNDAELMDKYEDELISMMENTEKIFKLLRG